MPKIKNTDARKHEKTKEREQLIAPFHEADVGARLFGCQRKNRLSTFSFIAKVRATYGWPSDAHHSRWLGHQSNRPRQEQRERRCNDARVDALSRQALPGLSLFSIQRQRRRRRFAGGTHETH